MYAVCDFGSRTFLRWAGGKQALARTLSGGLPPLQPTARYYEPFMGAGSVFMAYRPAAARLSDWNGHLIDMYIAVRDKPELVYRYLLSHARRDSEDYYYDVRRDYNRSRRSAARAARFIYLNRACFNGVFRVNRSGRFNVPYGFKDTLRVPSIASLQKWSRVLRCASLAKEDFREAVADARPDDVVYLDPPYPPLNGTSYFCHYTKERFGKEDQAAVASVARDLDRKGCRVMVSNADLPEIRDLYSGWSTVTIVRARNITSKARVRKVKELVITNY